MVRRNGGRYLLSRVTRYRSGRKPQQSQNLKTVIKLNVKGLLYSTTCRKIYE